MSWMPLDTSTEVIRALLQMCRLNNAGRPLGQGGGLSSTAGCRLLGEVKVSDAEGLSSLAEPILTMLVMPLMSAPSNSKTLHSAQGFSSMSKGDYTSLCPY